MRMELELGAQGQIEVHRAAVVIGFASPNVHFRGKSGHGFGALQCPLMIPIGLSSM